MHKVGIELHFKACVERDGRVWRELRFGEKVKHESFFSCGVSAVKEKAVDSAFSASLAKPRERDKRAVKSYKKNYVAKLANSFC